MEYVEVMGKALLEDVQNLKPGSLWLDAGSGNASAIAEYLFDGAVPLAQKSRTLAVAYAPAHTDARLRDAESAGKFSGIFGRFIEDIPNAQIGFCDLITDVLGPIAYSSRIDQVLQKYMDLLTPQGTVWVSGSNNYIVRKSGTVTRFPEWLKTLPGIAVEINGISAGKGVGGASGAFALRKTTQGVRIPRLKLVNIQPGFPPDKFFLEVD